MSPRNFSRAFRAEVGMTPAAWVEASRVDLAKGLLETTFAPTEAVAAECGFGTVETLRRAFARRVGVSPGQYRERFRAAALTKETQMEIAIPLYDRFTALDAVGPYQVLSALPEARVRFIAAEAGPVRADNRMLTLVAEASLDDVPSPDIFVLPGGIGTRALLEDEHLIGWIRSAHETSRYTTSVCTGSLLLAAAGILDGVDATTHWMVRDFLGELGANPVTDRVVERGKVITAAGVSSGIDMALRAGRPDRRAGGVPGDPAGDRVRPPAAVRLRLAREGAEGDRGPGGRGDGPDGVGSGGEA